MTATAITGRPAAKPRLTLAEIATVLGVVVGLAATATLFVLVSYNLNARSLTHTLAREQGAHIAAHDVRDRLLDGTTWPRTAPATMGPLHLPGTCTKPAPGADI